MHTVMDFTTGRRLAICSSGGIPYGTQIEITLRMNQGESKLNARTKEAWQPRTANNLSDEDAREIAENVTGFFKLLLEWEASEKERTAREADDSYYPISA
jgi:hypothetical protein